MVNWTSGLSRMWPRQRILTCLAGNVLYALWSTFRETVSAPLVHSSVGRRTQSINLVECRHADIDKTLDCYLCLTLRHICTMVLWFRFPTFYSLLEDTGIKKLVSPTFLTSGSKIRILSFWRHFFSPPPLHSMCLFECRRLHDDSTVAAQTPLVLCWCNCIQLNTNLNWIWMSNRMQMCWAKVFELHQLIKCLNFIMRCVCVRWKRDECV